MDLVKERRSPPITITYTHPIVREATTKEFLEWLREARSLTDANAAEHMVAWEKSRGMVFIDQNAYVFEPGKVLSVTVGAAVVP